MIQKGTEICNCTTCTRPGCSPSTGCQGHAMREVAPEYVKAKAEAPVAEAARWGVVLTIEQVPLQPLAMGHYETRVGVRAARENC